MEHALVEHLARQSRAPRVVIDGTLDQALAALDAELAGLAGELEVEYFGPGVGVDADPDAYRLVIKAHREDVGEPGWSLRVCDSAPSRAWHSMWAVHGVGRLRKVRVVRALGDCLAGYLAAVEAAGKADTGAGARLRALVDAFQSAGDARSPG